jgi:acetyltransferase-like isoleucine patch superfamily enzyme
MDKPVVKISDVQERFNPQTYTVFVAVGYQGMNALRSEKYRFFKNLGYIFATYKSPNVFGAYTIGENSIVMDGAIIQPYASFGNNGFVWGGAMVGHHAAINDDCWLTGGCLIGGSVKLGRGTFIGMGAVLGQEVQTGIECMLGAGTLTIRNIGDKAVVVEQQTDIHRLNSEQFTRMSVCFRM